MQTRAGPIRSPISFGEPIMFAKLMSSVVLVVSAGALFADDWPQWLGPQRAGVWRETGIQENFPKEGPKIRWKAPLGQGYSGPAVAAGKVYVTDQVLAADARNPRSGFDRPRLAGSERVLCLDDKTGRVLWKHEYD